MLRNLGVSDPEGQAKLLLKDRCDSSKLLFLKSGCLVISRFVPQLAGNIQYSLLENKYVDILKLLPSSFTKVDLEELLKSDMSIIEEINASGGELISNIFVISKKLHEKINNQLNKLCVQCAEKVNKQNFF